MQHVIHTHLCAVVMYVGGGAQRVLTADSVWCVRVCVRGVGSAETHPGRGSNDRRAAALSPFCGFATARDTLEITGA